MTWSALRRRIADLVLGPRHTVSIMVDFPREPDAIRATYHGIRAHSRAGAALRVLRAPACREDMPGFSTIRVEVVAEIGATSA